MSRVPYRLGLALTCLSTVACEPVATPSEPQPQATQVLPTASAEKAAKKPEGKVRPRPKSRALRAPEAVRKRAVTERSPNDAPPPPDVCPAEMALVEGDHCRSVEQPCLEFLQTEKNGPDQNRCTKFGPSRCTDPKPPRAMRYCMDRHEYPGTPGALPMTLVSWTEAARLCDVQGKRLCTESEFTFACEGEEMRPYAVGFERSPDQCNIDRPYRTPSRKMMPSPQCEANTSCAAEMKRIDGRRPISESSTCVSPFGIFDLNGNANEWVSRPWKEAPHRSAIKGGWWGPVRNRCRAITTAHDETYLGYEVGFRCCKDAASTGPGKQP